MQLLAAGGAPDSVVADLDTAWGQDVLQEAFDKFERRKGDVADLLSFVVAVVETDLSVIERFQTAISDGAAEDVAAQILQDLFTAAGRLTVDDPFFLPKGSRQTTEQSRLVKSGTDFGAENHREGLDGDQEPGLGINPGVIGREASGGDEHVDVGMQEHGPGPGMENGKSAKAGAKITGIVGEFL